MKLRSARRVVDRDGTVVKEFESNEKDR